MAHINLCLKLQFSDLVSVVFSPDEPFIVAPSHLDCSLNADLIVYTEAESGGPVDSNRWTL